MESSFGNTIQSAVYSFDGKSYTEDKNLGPEGKGKVRALAPTEEGAPSLALKTGKEVADEIKAYRDVGEHKNVLKFLGETETPDGPGLITEKAEGGDLHKGFTELRKMYEKGALGHSDYVGTVQHLLGGTTEGLAHIASKDVVHRDIKPPNILLDATTKEAKIADFGLAAKHFAGLQKKGSEDYLPQDDRYASPKQDVYALGATAYESMGNGAVGAPFDEKVIETGQTGVGSDFHKFVAHTTAHDPRARPTAEQALKEPFLSDPLVAPDRAKEVLQKMLDARNGVATPPPPAPEVRPDPTPEHREKYAKVMEELYGGQYD